jgi:DNA primase
MQRERKLSALRRALKDDGYVKGDEGSFFCTYSKGCAGQHHKRKLQVNLESDIFHCWVCNWKGGSLLPILRRLGDADPDYLDYKAEHEKKPKTEAGGKVYETPRLPKEFQTLSKASGTLYYHQAIGYLTQRGVTSEDILDYKMGFCTEGKYADRIILPSFDDMGELNFFVGRAIWTRLTLPYLSGEFDKDIVFNDLLVDWTKPITLVEGPFDAIKAGHNAIALQGKLPSKRLMAKIHRHMPRTYIALDADASSDALKIATNLVNNGVETLIINWPDGVKDPGELTKAEFDELRRRAIPIVTMGDLMKQQVYNSGSTHA